jgi:hypothetical protein
MTTDMQQLEGLKLLIEPSPEDRAEIARLERKCSKQQASSVAFDDNDHDPEYTAERLAMIASDLFKQERNRNERAAANAERYYAARGKEMNKHLGFRN